jgi:hypothetical protein
MSRQTPKTLEGQAELVQVGGRTYRVRTQIVVEEVEGEAGEAASETSEVRSLGDGSFEMLLSDADATSIDRSEQAILRTSWPAMRDALSRHLSAISQKKPKKP